MGKTKLFFLPSHIYTCTKTVSYPPPVVTVDRPVHYEGSHTSPRLLPGGSGGCCSTPVVVGGTINFSSSFLPFVGSRPPSDDYHRRGQSSSIRLYVYLPPCFLLGIEMSMYPHAAHTTHKLFITFCAAPPSSLGSFHPLAAVAAGSLHPPEYIIHYYFTCPLSRWKATTDRRIDRQFPRAECPQN